MKKAVILVVLVIAIFLTSVLTAFFGVNGLPVSGHGSGTGEVQLTFMNSWGGYDTKAGVIDSLLLKFQKENKGVTVVNKTLSGDDFLPAIKEEFATGNQPDIFGLWPGSDITSLINAGKVADLTSVVDADPVFKNSFDPTMWSKVRHGGRIYGLPVEITFQGLFVNKDLFDKYKVQVPTDYDSLVKAIKIFRAHGIIPISFNCKPEGSYIYQNIAMSLGGKDIETPIKNGKVNDCYIKAMYIMRNLYSMGAFPENSECFSMDSNARDDLFLNKKAAMIVQGSWFIDKCSSDSVMFTYFPKMNANAGDRLVYGLGCGTFYISKRAWDDSAKREKAIKLIKYLSSRGASMELAQRADMLTNIEINDDKIDYKKLTQTGLNLIRDADTLVGPPDTYFTRSVWENVIVKNFPDMLTGDISPEDLWKKAIAAGIEVK